MVLGYGIICGIIYHIRHLRDIRPNKATAKFIHNQIEILMKTNAKRASSIRGFKQKLACLGRTKIKWAFVIN